MTALEEFRAARVIALTISGQIRSGKNHMQITRSGRHYPLPEWAAWRDRVVLEISRQSSGAKIVDPCKVVVKYFTGDRRRRDVPGIMDALWHCLEKAGIIADDKLLEDVAWESRYDKENPRAIIRIETKNPSDSIY